MNVLAEQMNTLASIMLGREITGHPEAALRREWLVTNGIGGFAMSSLLASAATRGYHGLLIAALDPPLGRALLVGGLQIWARLGDFEAAMSSLEFVDGSVAPDGWRNLQSFALEGSIPVMTFTVAEALVEQRVWMQHGRNTTYVQFRHARGRAPIELRMQPLVTARNYHGRSRPPGWRPEVRAIPNGALVEPGDGYPAFRLLSAQAQFVPLPEAWVSQIFHRVEAQRGHDSEETLYRAGEFHATLQPGASVTLIFAIEEDVQLDGDMALHRERERLHQLLSKRPLDTVPPFIRQLILSADQFIISRPLPDGAQGHSVIAGYPWFTDWGRDTMIALPGLALATGRHDLAVSILRTFSAYVSQGMLPNRFPDASEQPEYNTVDATLWYFEALRATIEVTGDLTLAADLYPQLEHIIEWHRQGTRYSIRVDDDGLLRAGVPGVQLTWMDAKVDDWVVTPRIGKPVEINALWYNALNIMAHLSRRLGRGEPARFEAEAARVHRAFGRFWYADGRYLYDVLDTPDGGDDPSFRPNQLLAVSLHYSPLPVERARAVVDACARHLLTSYGLRSLAPFEPQYIASYIGDRPARDGAYHQGTTWAWLIGPFVSAYQRVYGDPGRTRSFLEPFAQQLYDACLGSISEIFDGNPPFTPRGCPAQAWSIAEVLRCWFQLSSKQ